MTHNFPKMYPYLYFYDSYILAINYQFQSKNASHICSNIASHIFSVYSFCFLGNKSEKTLDFKKSILLNFKCLNRVYNPKASECTKNIRKLTFRYWAHLEKYSKYYFLCILEVYRLNQTFSLYPNLDHFNNF